MKKILRLVWMLIAMVFVLASNLWQQKAEAVAVPLAGTAYQITLPADWKVETQTDQKQAIVKAASPDGALTLRVYRSSHPTWTLDDWKAALQEGMKRGNSVADLAERTVAERRWLMYNLLLDQLVIRSAVTEADEGVFITMEFWYGPVSGEDESEAFDRMVDACLASLAAMP